MAPAWLLLWYQECTFRYSLNLPISYLTCNLFRDPNDATGLLFATENNTEIKIKYTRSTFNKVYTVNMM